MQNAFDLVTTDRLLTAYFPAIPVVPIYRLFELSHSFSVHKVLIPSSRDLKGLRTMVQKHIKEGWFVKAVTAVNTDPDSRFRALMVDTRGVVSAQFQVQ